MRCPPPRGESRSVCHRNVTVEGSSLETARPVFQIILPQKGYRAQITEAVDVTGTETTGYIGRSSEATVAALPAGGVYSRPTAQYVNSISRTLRGATEWNFRARSPPCRCRSASLRARVQRLRSPGT